jgi:hypothetical protein
METTTMKIQSFRSKYDGVCVKCGEQFLGYLGSARAEGRDAADEITWIRQANCKGYYHVRCEKLATRPELCSYLNPATGKYEKSDGSLNNLPKLEDIILPSDRDEVSEPVAPAAKAKSATTSQPAVAVSGDIFAQFAAVLTPHLDGMLKAKLDGVSGEVENLISERVSAAVREMCTRTIVVQNEQTGETRSIDGRFHRLLPKLVMLLQRRIHVFQFGGPGSSKSHSTMQAAEIMGLRWGYKSLVPQMSVYDIFGYKDANGNVVRTEFVDFYENGGVFSLEELDNAHPTIQAALNTALENGFAAFPCGTVKMHPDFVLVANGNTNGLGATPQFPGRSPMDGALRDRFRFLAWEYDEKLESDIALDICPEHGKVWFTYVRKVRAYVASNKLRLIVSPRATYKGCKEIGISSAEEIADGYIFKGIDVDTRAKVMQACPVPSLPAVA